MKARSTGMLALMLRRTHVSAWQSSSIHRNSWVKRITASSFSSIGTSDGMNAVPDSILHGQTITEWINDRVKSAMGKSFGDEYYHSDTMITPATKVNFGDFQCNAAFSIAKPLEETPRNVALQLIETLDVGEVFETPTIAGPGFINLHYREDYIFSQLQYMLRDGQNRLGVPLSSNPQKVVIDFSSPNIAKEMHVGHLRSTIIGDVLSRVLEFRGHHVVRLNHVGDWGTQFGMLITLMRELKADETSIELTDLVSLYKQAKLKFDEDDEFRGRSREAVVALQSGDSASLKSWRLLCEKSRKEFDRIYQLLTISGLEERGESFYNPMLDSIIETLDKQGLVEESEGAKVVYLDGFTARDGTSRQPLIIKKSDGGFNYAATDLAAVKQRTSSNGECADRLLYVVDAGQGDHFEQVFQVARRGGLVDEDANRRVTLEHVKFGVVLGEDGKKLKTRSGETVKLIDLLNESISKAKEGLVGRDIAGADMPYSSNLTVDEVARVVGIGAVKYADLSMSRDSNYRFSFSKMLALNGNTAPYMLYAYARIQGINRKLDQTISANTIKLDAPLEHKAEKALAKHLLKLPEVVLKLEKDLYPHFLCDYLFELGQHFNQFYENCPVNQAQSPELQSTRAALCKLTANTLKTCLGLLGIGVVDVL